MRFPKLQFPESWSHYWSKYPEGFTILESLISWVSQVDKMTEKLNENQDEIADRVTKKELKDNRKLDEKGNFTGSWFGLTKPTLSDEGMKATVEKINDIDLPKINSQISDITILDSFNFESNKTYKITKDNVLSNPLVINNKNNIVIDFNNTTLDISNISTNKAINILNSNNIVIKNLNIINNSKTNLVYAIYFENTEKCVATNISGVGGVRDDNLEFTSYYNMFALVCFDKSKFGLIEKCYAKNFYAPYRFMYSSEKCIMRDNNAEYCKRFAMFSGSGDFPGSENTYPGTKYCICENNKCNFIDQIFIKIEPDCTGSICRNNYICNVGSILKDGEVRNGGVICFYRDTECYENTILSTNIDFKGFKGIGGIHAYLNGKGNNNIHHNTIKNLSCSGISLGDTTEFNIIERNLIIECGEHGIKMSNFSTGNNHNYAIDNTIKNCVQDGIHARYSFLSEIINNNIIGCNGLGIQAESAKNTVIKGNTIKDCINNPAIRLTSPSESCLLDSNRIINCAINDINKRAITIGDNVLNITVINNIVISENSTFGIYIGKTINLICNNNNCTDCGLFINSSANKLSTNKNFEKGNEV